MGVRRLPQTGHLEHRQMVFSAMSWYLSRWVGVLGDEWVGEACHRVWLTLSEDSLDDCPKLSKIALSDFPNLIEIDSKIFMDQHIAHSRDFSPSSARAPLACRRRDFLNGFPDRFELPHDRVLTHRVRHKLLAAG